MKESINRIMQMMAAVLVAVAAASHTAEAQSSTEADAVKKVASDFFVFLEKGDSLGMKNIFVKTAGQYVLVDNGDTARYYNKQVLPMRFRPGEVVRERMRDKEVEIRVHKTLATVWAPYDLWINDKYSHCGVDIFNMVKTASGWKIFTIAYTIEKQGCK